MNVMVCGRYRLSCCYWVLAIFVVVALLELLQLDMGPRSSRVVRNEEATSVSSWERSFSAASYLTSSHNGANLQGRNGANFSSAGILIFKGKPKTPFPSPKSPIPLSQPTLSHPTLQMKQLHFSHGALKSSEEVLGSVWVPQLRDVIGKVHLKKQVSIVFSNSGYIESLLNWLIAAKVRLSPPIANILVVCLDMDVYRILYRRNISSLYIDPSTAVNMTQLQRREYKYTVWMVRFVVFRMINYWGYDFVSYDTDALILKNPQELFQQHGSSDIVSSAGKFPFALSKDWGFTICMGVIMFRSTPRTELLWESIRGDTRDDQVLLNYALKACHIQWQANGRSITNQSITGQCHNTGLKVTVLPLSEICRYKCGKEGFHVWHRNTKKVGSVKKTTAKEGGHWYLRDNWRSLNSVVRRKDIGKLLKGTNWLTLISVS